VIQEYDDPTLYARGTHVPTLENEELMLAVLSESTYVVLK
jgi:hypothetical protein